MGHVRQRLREVAVPLAFLLVITGLDLVLGRNENTFLAPILLACPALAAATAGPVSVAIIGVLVLVTRQGLALYDDAVTELARPAVFYNRTLGYLAVIAVSVYLAWRRQRSERKLEAVTSVALTAQQAILRSAPETGGEVRVGLRYIAAADEASIGGDLYEVISTQYGTRVLIGDVKGSGLGAVYAASLVLGAFRATAYDEPDLAAIASKAEATVYRHLGPDDFITALFVQIGPAGLTLLHRGHVPALVINDEEGTVHSAEPPVAAPPLGLSHLVTTRAREWTVPFGASDILLLYTDGVIEARGPGGFYPLAQRAAALVDSDLEASAGRLHADLLRHTGRSGKPLADDAVIMLIARDNSLSPASQE
ncbi:PP2C family protein-serine/threonine phosphatase [Longispora albida]|uniref:PP2C family protein-serine/threonine phosphatase n=1 Tax=Longispora albida TaxID=203523 RepID=UPI000367A62F|nr:PP2C family protein-serine/threonine phosphatase [Longispora albida]